MKKTGFTLAEVLITLAIIGVVATMTLPALMANTQEQQAKAGLKKVVNTLTLAAEMSAANKGFDYSSIMTASNSNDNEESMSVLGLLRANTQVDEKAVAKYGLTQNTSNFVVFFRDGSSFEFPFATTSANSEASFKGVIDINGAKSPNVLSTCVPTALATNGGSIAVGTTAKDNAGSTTDTACETKSNRIIKDKFSVILQGQHVDPNGPAARWTMGIEKAQNNTPAASTGD